MAATGRFALCDAGVGVGGQAAGEGAGKNDPVAGFAVECGDGGGKLAFADDGAFGDKAVFEAGRAIMHGGGDAGGAGDGDGAAGDVVAVQEFEEEGAGNAAGEDDGAGVDFERAEDARDVDAAAAWVVGFVVGAGFVGGFDVVGLEGRVHGGVQGEGENARGHDVVLALAVGLAQDGATTERMP